MSGVADVLAQRAEAALVELAGVRDALAAEASLGFVESGLVRTILGLPGDVIVGTLNEGRRAQVVPVVDALDQVVTGSGPRLVARIRGGELAKYDSLRVLLANAEATARSVTDDIGGNLTMSAFWRDVVARSAADLEALGQHIVDALPAVGFGLGAGVVLAVGAWLALR